MDATTERKRAHRFSRSADSAAGPISAPDSAAGPIDATALAAWFTPLPESEARLFSSGGLLDALRPDSSAVPPCPTPIAIASTLHDYQCAALRWMLAREQGILESAHPQPLGGILAEEMGLGKTVEVLALVAARQRSRPRPPPLALEKKKKKAKKGASGAAGSDAAAAASTSDAGAAASASIADAGAAAPQLVPSRATVIVTPSAIVEQWQSEIQQHAPGLNVCTCLTSAALRSVSLETLAECDVALLTYDVVAAEFYTMFESATRGSSRHAKKYEMKSSILTKLEFWRVVLDEVQLAPGSRQAGKTVRALASRLRWAVTGTPIGAGGIDDLGELCSFVGGDEWLNGVGWEQLARAYKARRPGAAAALARSLQGMLWRQTKAHVFSEVVLPPQSSCVETIELPLAERQLYECFTAPEARKALADGKARNTILASMQRTLLAPVTESGPLLKGLQRADEAALSLQMRSGARSHVPPELTQLKQLVEGDVRAHADDVTHSSQLAALALVASRAGSAKARAAATMAFTVLVIEPGPLRDWAAAVAEEQAARATPMVDKRYRGYQFVGGAHQATYDEVPLTGERLRAAQLTRERRLQQAAALACVRQTFVDELDPSTGTRPALLDPLGVGSPPLDLAEVVRWGHRKPSFDVYRAAVDAAYAWSNSHGSHDLQRLADPRCRANQLVFGLALRLDAAKRDGVVLSVEQQAPLARRAASARLASLLRLDAIRRLRPTAGYGWQGQAGLASLYESPHAAVYSPQVAPSTPGGAPQCVQSLPRWATDTPEGFSSRVAWLVKLLRRLAPAKVVVFSKFKEGIKHIAGALAATGIGATTMTGTVQARRSLATFLSDKECQAILLHAGSAAAGLTLTVAEHVVLLDALQDPALVLQAVGRVHRIGQTKPTTVRDEIRIAIS